MYIIDASYFQREYYIPNVQELQSNELNDLELYIDNKVRQFLRDVLGYELFTDLDSNIENGVLKNDAPQKWKDLINGSNDWQGLIFQDGAFKSSLLVPYVFYHWLYDNVSEVTSTGEKENKTANAQNIASTQRLVKSWNDFVRLYQGDNSKIGVFKTWINGTFYADYYGSENSYKTMREFLKENKTDFETAVLPVYNYKNYLGL